MKHSAELSLEDFAKLRAGDHLNIRDFAWFRRSELDDPENWTIVYTSNRDSGLLDQSNAAIIDKIMTPFSEQEDDPDVVFESHNHWAVGHVDGFSIRVYRGGKVTDAFSAYFETQRKFADYPILDEEDYSARELEATKENIKNAAWSVKNDYIIPDEWVDAVYDWFWQNDQDAIENRDDQGGYPSDEQLVAAFTALNYEKKPE